MNLQEIFNKWNIKCDINTVLSMWNESHRHYHTLDHLNDILEMIENDKESYTEKEYEKLVITALFHDCVYDPMKSDNEEKSADFFEQCCVDKNADTNEIGNMILETKTHQSNSKLSKAFIDYDMDIINRDYDSLLEWEKGIYGEFKVYGNEAYKFGRLKFLESLLDKKEYIGNTENILKLMEYVKEEY